MKKYWKSGNPGRGYPSPSSPHICSHRLFYSFILLEQYQARPFPIIVNTVGKKTDTCPPHVFTNWEVFRTSLFHCSSFWRGQGSHRHWKTWNTWKNETTFSSQGKVREFCKNVKKSGKSQGILNESGKSQGKL